MNARPIALAALTMALSGPALAAWPDDVLLSQMATYDGAEVTDTGTLTESYHQVVRELAATVANKPLAPAETLGIHGFDVSLVNKLGFISADSDDPANPSAWMRTHTDANPSRAIWVPGVQARKGLPMGLEVGASMGYLSFSRQGNFGAWGRWGLVEGYKQYPDFSIQMGYAKYVGNPEFDLGVSDMSARLGYTWAFGRYRGVNTANFSPYVGAGLLRINAQPRLSPTQQTTLGVAPASGFKNKDGFQEGFSPADVHLGFQIKSGDVQFTGAATVAIAQAGATATLNSAFGYVF